MNDHVSHVVVGKIHSVQIKDAQGFETSLIEPFDSGGVGLAKNVSYTVQFVHPQIGPVLLPGVKPCNQRWPEPMKIVPAKSGTKTIGSVDEFGIVEFTIIELFGVAKCPDNSTPPGGTANG